MRQHDEFLQSIPLFAGLDHKDLHHLQRVVTEIDVRAGTVLMEEGAAGHEMVIVVSGSLEVTRHGQHIADIGPGGFAGELAILTHRHRSSTVKASTDCRLLHIDGRNFGALLHDVPQLAVAILPIVASRVGTDGEH